MTSDDFSDSISRPLKPKSSKTLSVSCPGVGGGFLISGAVLEKRGEGAGWITPLFLIKVFLCLFLECTITVISKYQI